MPLPEKPLLAHPLDARRLPAHGTRVTVQADAATREALAEALDLLACEHITGTFEVSGSAKRVHVKGTVTARVQYRCIVTLEPFWDTVSEAVDVIYTDTPSPAVASPALGSLSKAMTANEIELALDGADEEPLVDGIVDLGALTQEFFALGLSLYPRRPDAEFQAAALDPEPHPFAALEALKSPSR
jgi:hypothetical protein